jgi:hypothetical protein
MHKSVNKRGRQRSPLIGARAIASGFHLRTLLMVRMNLTVASEPEFRDRRVSDRRRGAYELFCLIGRSSRIRGDCVQIIRRDLRQTILERRIFQPRIQRLDARGKGTRIEQLIILGHGLAR